VKEILRLARKSTFQFFEPKTFDHAAIKERLNSFNLSLPEPWHGSEWKITNGSITVGCTTIPWKEVEMVGKKILLWD
jgi:hypothetical protein